MISRTTTTALAIATLFGTTRARAEGPETDPAGHAAPQAEVTAEVPQVPPAHGTDGVIGLHAEPVMMVPMGSLANVTGPGIGGLLGLDYRLSNAWLLTGRAGYIAGSSATLAVAGATVNSSLSYAPALAGAKVYLAGTDWAHLYAAGEGGVVIITNTASADAGDASVAASGSSTHVCASLSAGLELDMLDLRVGLLAADVAHADSSTVAMVSLGFRFATF